MKFKFWGRAAESSAARSGPLSEEGPKKRRAWMRSLGGLFKAAGVTSNDSWMTTAVTPDAFISMHLNRLVARSREQWSNNDYVRGFVRLVRQNIVGPNGVTMQAKVMKPRGGLDKEINAAIEGWWAEWGKPQNCDVTGKRSWRAIQCLTAETAARDGEFIARMIFGPDAGPMGFALQLIDTHRLSVQHDEPNRSGGGFIRHGIEYNRYGRPIAYHFTSTDETDANYYTYGGKGFVRVAAEEIVHGFVHEMVGQRRGLPWASTSLFRLHHLQGFEDAAVQNARAGASKMGFIQYESGFGPEADDDTPLTIDAEPLSFHELPEGARLADFNPQYPSGEFAVFHKAMLRGAATGMGVTYNGLANDLEGVNFSSIRQGTLDEREHWKECQQWLIESLVEPVFNAWLRYQLLAGNIKTKNGKPLDPAKLATYAQVAWQPRRWQWIDPRADVEAAIASIRAGLTSPSQVIREQGRDPADVYAEIADDIEQMKGAGIPDDVVELFFTGQPKKPEPKAPAKAEADSKPDKAAA